MSMNMPKFLPAIAAFSIALQVAIPAGAQNYNGYGNAQSNNYGYGANTATTPNLQGRVAYLPAGLTFPVQLQTSISTDVARPGDTVQATLSQPIQLGNSIIPAGSTIIGSVTNAKSGGFMGRSGMLTMKFNRLRTPSGLETPLSASIVGGVDNLIANGTDTFRGETWKTKAGQAAIRGGIGAGTGAALGTAIGAIAGSHGTRGQALGRGAWSGAAIGGGLGVAQSLILRKGKNVVISSGQQMQLQLDAPVTLSQNVTMGAF